jgi:hypothetical protein
MLPFALKVVWFVLTIIGTIFSCLSLMALGRIIGTRWAPLSFNIGMVIYQGMFCLGMIWRMDPYRMPRAFCFAQIVGMDLGIYFIAGCCFSFCIATSSHILKPKQWGDISKSFTWRPVYYFPVIGYPAVTMAVRVFLLVKYDAVHPFDGLHCDAADPLLVRLAGPLLPSVLVVPPTLYLSAYSARHVIRTLRHIKRARKDDTELPRQMRRERLSGHYSYKQTGPVLGDDLPQRIDLPTPVKDEAPKRSFHLPFFCHPGSTSQTLTPPPSPNPSTSPWDDGRSSVASSSFPTFAPVVDQPVFTTQRPSETETDVADESGTWLDEDSRALTTLEGRETPEVELDVKSLDDDDGTFRLSYRENASTPSKLTQIQHIPLLAPQIRRLLLVQVMFPISTILAIVGYVADDLTHPQVPRPIGFADFVQLSLAWTGLIVFGTLPSVRAEICRTWRRG